MAEDIQHYDVGTGTLTKKETYKVRRILELNRLQFVTEGHYQCLPIPGYNKTTYNLIKTADGWFCNCQGFGKRRTCSHEKALVLLLRPAFGPPPRQMDLYR